MTKITRVVHNDGSFTDFYYLDEIQLIDDCLVIDGQDEEYHHVQFVGRASKVQKIETFRKEVAKE